MSELFKKKPVVIEAVQWTGTNSDEVSEFMNWRNHDIDEKNGLVIHTLEGNHQALIGDFIIKGVHGEFYPCKPDIFAKTYDPVSGKEPFKREIRYIVLKIKDVEQLNKIEQKALKQICDSVDEIRIARGKLSFEAVVVESDWPEYETVWSMIESRMGAAT